MRSKIVIQKPTDTSVGLIGVDSLLEVYDNTKSGDLVVVYPGTYDLGANGIKLKDGVNFLFMPGVVINSTNPNGAFYDDGVEVHCTIQGSPKIINGAGAAINLTNQSSSCPLNNKNLTVQNLPDPVLFNEGDIVTVEGGATYKHNGTAWELLSSTGFDVIFTTGEENDFQDYIFGITSPKPDGGKYRVKLSTTNENAVRELLIPLPDYLEVVIEAGSTPTVHRAAGNLSNLTFVRNNECIKGKIKPPYNYNGIAFADNVTFPDVIGSEEEGLTYQYDGSYFILKSGTLSASIDDIIHIAQPAVCFIDPNTQKWKFVDQVSTNVDVELTNHLVFQDGYSLIIIDDMDLAAIYYKNNGVFVEIPLEGSLSALYGDLDNISEIEGLTICQSNVNRFYQISKSSSKITFTNLRCFLVEFYRINMHVNQYLFGKALSFYDCDITGFRTTDSNIPSDSIFFYNCRLEFNGTQDFGKLQNAIEFRQNCIVSFSGVVGKFAVFKKVRDKVINVGLTTLAEMFENSFDYYSMTKFIDPFSFSFETTIGFDLNGNIAVYSSYVKSEHFPDSDIIVSANSDNSGIKFKFGVLTSFMNFNTGVIVSGTPVITDNGVVMPMQVNSVAPDSPLDSITIVPIILSTGAVYNTPDTSFKLRGHITVQLKNDSNIY